MELKKVNMTRQTFFLLAVHVCEIIVNVISRKQIVVIIIILHQIISSTNQTTLEKFEAWVYFYGYANHPH